MQVYVMNIHPYNWEKCKAGPIFGIRKGSIRYDFDKGDIFLVRTTGKDYGIRGIWVFQKQQPVNGQTEVPWEDDAEYDSILYFDPLILEFEQEFSEEFTGKSKYSEKVKLNASRIIGSFSRLRASESRAYLGAILREKEDTLNVTAEYLGSDVIVSEFMEQTISKMGKIKEKKTKKPKRAYEIEDLVGDPINFRGIVYAPLNEAGVILLFSKVMNDLGIFYESSPSKGFDMIGRRRTEKGLEKVNIEFEFESRNFLIHEHDPEIVDLIVCWEHNWKDCPIEVIPLKEVIEQLQGSKDELHGELV